MLISKRSEPTNAFSKEGIRNSFGITESAARVMGIIGFLTE